MWLVPNLRAVDWDVVMDQRDPNSPNQDHSHRTRAAEKGDKGETEKVAILPSGLPESLENDADFTRLTDRWPSLLSHVKQTVFTLVASVPDAGD
jgi:hypothetical protein